MNAERTVYRKSRRDLCKATISGAGGPCTPEKTRYIRATREIRTFECAVLRFTRRVGGKYEPKSHIYIIPGRFGSKPSRRDTFDAYCDKMGSPTTINTII